MDTKHTYSTPYGGREVYRDGKPFAIITGSKEAEQGAKLFIALSDFGKMAAAAPDMLAALEAIAPIWANADPRDRTAFGETARMVQAAIAKAKGGNP